MILEDSSSNSSVDSVVFGMNGLEDDGMKGLEDDGMKGLGDDGIKGLGDDGLRDDTVYPVVDVEVITDDSVDNSDSDGFISDEKVVDVDVDVLIPKSKIIFRFLLFKIFLKYLDLDIIDCTYISPK